MKRGQKEPPTGTSARVGRLRHRRPVAACHIARRRPHGLPSGRARPDRNPGWRGVTGGANGLWGRAALPDQTKCPPGTGGTVGSTVPCGNGAVGIDNLWHDLDKLGGEVPAGSNPLWHAKNLQDGRTPSYLDEYGLDPADPEHRVTGTYTRHYDATLVAPWPWNADKRVFLSTEDDASIAAKAGYVVDQGIGGIMMWELAGDYDYDATRGEYFMGDTLTTLMYDTFRTAGPYGNTKAERRMPTEALDVQLELHGFPVGDSNYPISPKLRVTNNSSAPLPGGMDIQFDYGTSAPPTMGQQSGWSMSVVSTGHTGPNVGGIRGDLHRMSLKTPSWQTLAPGASAEVQLVYYLPITQPANITLTFGGRTYAVVQDHARGPDGAPPTTTTPPTSDPTTTTTTPPACSAPAWDATTVYHGGDTVSHQGRLYQAMWWTQGDRPDLSGQWGVWQDKGAC